MGSAERDTRGRPACSPDTRLGSNARPGFASAADVLAAWQDRSLGLPAVEGVQDLASHLLLDPADAHLQELFGLVLAGQESRALAEQDPFARNAPMPGELPAVKDGIPLAQLPNGVLIQMAARSVCRNVGIWGPTGAGKSVLARNLIFALVQRGVSVICIDSKHGELADCRSFAESPLPFSIVDARSLPLPVLQPPRGMRPTDWAAVLVEVFARCFSLQASRRLLGGILEALYREERPADNWPTWRQLVGRLTNFKAAPLSREGQYREALLWPARTTLREAGPALDYVSSDSLERLQERPGCVVIRTDVLSAQVAAFLTGVIVQHIYELRARKESVQHRQLVFFLDDAMDLVKGSAHTDTQELSPISRMSLLARSRNVGFIVAAQSYALVSPAFRGNCDTHIVTGSYGKDAQEVARDFHLTKEQAAELPLLRPGQAVVLARSVWPRAVRGRFPEVP